jgi:hypothetical protein
MTLNSTNRARLNALASEHNALLFDYDSDGILVVNSNNFIHHLANLSDEQIESARLFLLQSIQPSEKIHGNQICTGVKMDCDAVSRRMMEKISKDHPLRNHLTIDTKDDILKDSEEISFLIQAILSEIESSDVILRFHFALPPKSWVESLQSAIELLAEPIKNKTIQIILSGPFELFSHEDYQFIVENNIHLEFVHDLVADSYGFSEQTRFIVPYLAEMGFRFPFVWYVDNRIIDKILSVIDEAMYLNFHSGFSLPAFQYSLHSQSVPFTDLAYNRYLQLLVDVYERYRFYDDILYPLNDIQILSLKPGCNDFVRRDYYDHRIRKTRAFPRTDVTEKIESFFLHSFLWQRRQIEIRYSYRSTSKK